MAVHDPYSEAVLKEIRNVVKGFAKGDGVPTLYSLGGVAAGANTKFSLPSRIYTARLISATAFYYAPDSAHSAALKSVAAATPEDISGFTSLANLHVAVATAGSGATIFAFVQPLPSL